MVTLDRLEKLSFCKGLTKEYMQRLVSLGEFKTYRPGDCIFYEGVTSAAVYLLIEGEVALETSLPGHDPVCMQTEEAGELLGWSPVLGLGYMTATARVLTPCRVLALNAAKILSLAEADPAFVLEFMRRTATTLARRLNATRLQVLEVYRDEAQEVS
jgi:CRP/FNR family cyclic AMP-dependent transcriptional regulator